MPSLAIFGNILMSGIRQPCENIIFVNGVQCLYFPKNNNNKNHDIIEGDCVLCRSMNCLVKQKIDELRTN